MSWEEFDRETKPLFNVFSKNDAIPLHHLRCQEEWGYALLMAYREADMHKDFINMTLDVLEFYLDPIYVQAIKKIAAHAGGEPVSVLNKEILTEMEKMTELEQHAGQYTSVMETTSHSIQKYIVFTLGMLITSTFSTDQNDCTKYHKFWCLIFIGMQEELREKIRALQKEQKYKDESRRKEVERRLEDLFMYCIQNVPELLNKPFNQHNSLKICDLFLLGAIKAYEGCL